MTGDSQMPHSLTGFRWPPLKEAAEYTRTKIAKPKAMAMVTTRLLLRKQSVGAAARTGRKEGLLGRLIGNPVHGDRLAAVQAASLRRSRAEGGFRLAFEGFQVMF